MSPNSGGTSPSPDLNSAIAQSGGRDAGTFSGMTAVRSETSECLALKIQNPIWRLIPLLNASGTVQMAIDRWLLDRVECGEHPPTLRFYTWEPVAISLGYHQRQYPEFWPELTWEGKPIDLVRRPTGGRAVLHQGDLTYMVALSGIPGARSYEAICEFLIQGWRSLGIELHYGRGGRGYIHHPSCFSTATAADLVTVRGEKLIGSAQLRRGRAILHHGSMRLSSDPALFQQVFGEAIAPVSFPWSQTGDAIAPTIIEALTAAARNCFGVEFVVEPLSQAEWEQIGCTPTNKP
jgi:lipoate---protein ligase